MRKVRIDGPSSGVGAQRTVWVGTTRVQERFVEWVPGERLTFAIIGSNRSGLASMVKDWSLAVEPADPTRSILTVTIGIAPSSLLKPFPKLVRTVTSKLTKRGQDGITLQFP